MEWNELKTNFWVGIGCLILGFLMCLIMFMSAGEILSTPTLEECGQFDNITVLFVPYGAENITVDNRNSTLSVNVPTYYIPMNSLEPVGHIIFSTNTSMSEPYYISKTPPTFEVGDWVKSNSKHEQHIRTEDAFSGKITEIDDEDVATIEINGDEYKYVNVYWLDHWVCEMIIHDPEIGYYCYTKLLDNTYQYKSNSSVISVIFEDVPFGECYE